MNGENRRKNFSGDFMNSCPTKRPLEDVSIQVDMEEGEEKTIFRLSSFQNFWLVLEIENCLSANIVQHNVDPDHMAVKVSGESFEIRCLFGQGVLRGFRLNAPIPRDRLDGLAPELKAMFVDTSSDAFLSLAEDTMGSDASTKFSWVALEVRELLQTLGPRPLQENEI